MLGQVLIVLAVKAENECFHFVVVNYSST